MALQEALEKMSEKVRTSWFDSSMQAVNDRVTGGQGQKFCTYPGERGLDVCDVILVRRPEGLSIVVVRADLDAVQSVSDRITFRGWQF